MRARGAAPRIGRIRRTGTATGALLLLAGCAWLPAEFNLSPFYRQRLDVDGTLLELDVLWPIVHYERHADGGSEFAIRPLWRLVRDGDRVPVPGIEHQFLWPFGRVRVDAEQSSARLLPLFSHVSRLDQQGRRETDWILLMPFVWGGTREDGEENYLAVFPLFADIPEFLTYDRFRSILFPLYVETHKGERHDHILLWPLVSWGGTEDGEESWFRVLPFYARNVRADRYERYSALWPFVHWGVEELGTSHEFTQFFLFPLAGWRTGERVHGWTALWPFFQEHVIDGRYYELELFWPLIHVLEDSAETRRIDQWWFWPLYGQTDSDVQRSWSMLWPVFWFREYDDPDGTQTSDWVLPIYWRVHRDRKDATEDDFVKIWPIAHSESVHDGTGDSQVLSPWPWRSDNARGIQELYGWIWTLARRREFGQDDRSFELMAHLFTERSRRGRTQWSVPFLFSYEGADDGGVLRLLQFLPIPFGGGGAPATEPRH